MKECTGCGERKDPADFPIKDGGRGSRCKQCKREENSARRRGDPSVAEAHRARAREYWAAHRVDQLDRNRQRRYGLEPGEYDRMARGAGRRLPCLPHRSASSR